MRPSKQLVYVFIFSGLALLISLVLTLVTKNQLLAERVAYFTIVDNASGLDSKPKLFFNGIHIGNFEQFELMRTGKIRAHLSIFKQYQYLITSSSVIVKSSNALLNNLSQYQLVQIPLSQSVLPAQQLIPYYTSEQGKTLLRHSKTAIESDQLSSLLADIKNTLAELRSGDNRQQGNLVDMVASVTELAQHADQLVQSVNSQHLSTKLSTTLSQSEQVLKQLKISLKTSNALFKSAEQTLKAYQNPTQLINGITDGKIPPILAHTEQSLLYLKSTLKTIDQQKQQLQTLILQSQQLINKLNATADAVNKTRLFALPLRKTSLSLLR